MTDQSRLHALLAELEPLTHSQRVQRMVAIGRGVASGDGNAAAVIEELAASDTYGRLLALQSVYGSRASQWVLAGLRDPSRTVRLRAAKLVALVCSDDEAREALAIIPGRRQRSLLAQQLVRRGRQAPVDAWVGQALAERELADPALVDLVPLCSEAALEPHIDALIERASPVTWSRLANRQPRLAADALLRRLGDGNAVATIEPRLRWHLLMVLSPLARRAPDLAMPLVDALLDHGEKPTAYLLSRALVWLVRLRPAKTFDLLRKQTQARERIRPPGAFSGLSFTKVAHRLGAERLAYLIEHAWTSLADDLRTRRWLLRLSDGDRHAVLEAWLERGRGAWGAFLLRFVPADGNWAEARERAYLRWSNAARSREGIIAPHKLESLPRDLREREARRHLNKVAALTSQPDQRVPYARLLGFAEAREVLESWLGHPEGDQRAMALSALLASVSHDRERVSDALDLAHNRRFEQDPVRLAMLQAFTRLPVRCFQAAHLEQVSAVIQDALDAADLSHPTVAAATELVVRLFRVDPSWGATWLTRLLETRGSVSLHGLGNKLTVADVERFAPAFRDLVAHWSSQERAGTLVALAASLGLRLHAAEPLLDALETLARDLPFVSVAGSALSLLRRRAPRRFAALVPELVEADESFALLQVVARHLSVRRQDLLHRVLLDRPVRGRFATGKTRWALHFGTGYNRWTPSLQARQAQAIRSLLPGDKLDTPTAHFAIHALAHLAFVPPDDLLALASDRRQPVREIAVRALPHLDGGQGVPALVGCLGDSRARWAIYALRRAFADMSADEVLAILRDAPMGKVTVAKEVVRLIGDMGGQAAYDQLIEMAHGDLHRDVRIALLRALWNHLERVDTWHVLERAAADPDWVVASRLTDIPLYRLSTESDARLAQLLALVLRRPEPEARLQLLRQLAYLPLNDRQGILFQAMLAHLQTQSVDEVALAVGAILHRTIDKRVETVVAGFETLLPRRRALVASLEVLTRHVGPYGIASNLRVARGVLELLEKDPLSVCRYLELAGKLLGARDLAAALIKVSERILLHADAMVAAHDAVRVCAHPETLEAELAGQRDPNLRRLALTALTCAAAPEDGWTAARRARLQRYCKDKSDLVAGAAAYVLPPEE